MSALTRYDGIAGLAPWQPHIAQLLDESHVAASSPAPWQRSTFGIALAEFLRGISDAEVCTLYGRYITNLEAFCVQLERQIHGPALERRIDGRRGVTALLRSRDPIRGRRPSRFRFYIWHDADVLLRADPRLFGRLVDALAGVAAEAEYASDDLLLLHRTVFLGGPVLDSYAKYEGGQFRSWYDDELGEPFWQVATGLERPPVRTLAIDRLGARL